jgi:hypothetical protein
MTSYRGKGCETSHHRHGCDPPKTVHAAPGRTDQRQTSTALKQSLIRLIELQPSLLGLVFRFHAKRRK